MKDLILASASPRRKELFSLLGYPYRIITSNIDEIMDINLPIEERIKEVAYQKGKAVYENNKDSIVVSADTVVVINDEILGKPKDKAMCEKMLHTLENKTHLVITGFAIINNEQVIKDYEITKVHFTKIDEKDIQDYIASSEPYDKAGGYAIQGWASQYIDYIEGNYHNVVGLPLYKIKYYLSNLLK